MKRELGIAYCGLACCLCSENAHCAGCRDGGCADKDWCENRRCAMEKGVEGCYACAETACRKGLLGKSKPRGLEWGVSISQPKPRRSCPATAG